VEEDYGLKKKYIISLIKSLTPTSPEQARFTTLKLRHRLLVIVVEYARRKDFVIT
jgi:hypothetical protein